MTVFARPVSPMSRRSNPPQAQASRQARRATLVLLAID